MDKNVVKYIKVTDKAKSLIKISDLIKKLKVLHPEIMTEEDNEENKKAETKEKFN